MLSIIVTIAVIIGIILFLSGRGWAKSAADAVVGTEKVVKATPVVVAKGTAVTAHVVGTGVTKGAHLTAVSAQKGASAVKVGAKVSKATAKQTKKVVGNGVKTFKENFSAELARQREEQASKADAEDIETTDRDRRVQASQQAATA